MAVDLHPLLLRQLKALGLDADAGGERMPGGWQALLAVVSHTDRAVVPDRLALAAPSDPDALRDMLRPRCGTAC